MIACGESDRPDWPYPGQALCRHKNKPFFNPAKWNRKLAEQVANNCYNYATCQKTGTFAQPGIGGCGHPPRDNTCAAWTTAAKADGLKPCDCDRDCPEQCWKVALVIDPRPNGDGDFHWYRQDEDGTWSHKPGGQPATNRDASGNPITDPRTADRNYQPGGGIDAPNYTEFCGCFCVCPPVSVASLDGRRAPDLAMADTKPAIQVTLMVHSGLANPTWALSAAQAHVLARRLKGLRKTKAVPIRWVSVAVRNPSRVSGIPETMLLHDGVIEVERGDKTEVLRDSAGLMDSLLQTGAETAHSEVIARIRSNQQETGTRAPKTRSRRRQEH